MSLISEPHELKVYHVLCAFPPALGGMEKVAQILAGMQTESGLDVTVITSNQRIHTPIEPEKFNVMRLKSALIANTTIMPGLIFKLIRIKRGSVVHLHVTQAFTPEMVWLASRIKGFRYIAHIHLDVPPSGPAGFLLKIYKPLFLKWVLRSAKFVIVFSNTQKTALKQKYGINIAKIKVVPNGVEEQFFNDTPRSLHKKPRLLFVGRLSYQKNLHQLLRALDGVSDQFEMNLVGDGEQKEELSQLANKLCLKNVHFLGRKQGDELLDLYRKSDVFVLSSEREGMPIVLLEAMAMGLPIVATDVSGSRDVVANNKNGLLVPYNDTDRFREALLEIGTNKAFYTKMSRASRKMAAQYSWHKIVPEFESLYIGAPE
jgi:glycosyltransferase involved in cell wall biosynthesis